MPLSHLVDFIWGLCCEAVEAGCAGRAVGGLGHPNPWHPRGTCMSRTHCRPVPGAQLGGPGHALWLARRSGLGWLQVTSLTALGLGSRWLGSCPQRDPGHQGSGGLPSSTWHPLPHLAAGRTRWCSCPAGEGRRGGEAAPSWARPLGLFPWLILPASFDCGKPRREYDPARGLRVLADQSLRAALGPGHSVFIRHLKNPPAG